MARNNLLQCRVGYSEQAMLEAIQDDRKLMNYSETVRFLIREYYDNNLKGKVAE